MNPKLEFNQFTLTEPERLWAGRLLVIVRGQNEADLDMLGDAVESGESKPDNPNIAEAERVLGYLDPLLKKIQASEGDLELSVIEGGQLEKLFHDAKLIGESSETDDEIEQAREQGLDDVELSDEARICLEIGDLLNDLSEARIRLREANFEWPKQYQD